MATTDLTAKLTTSNEYKTAHGYERYQLDMIVTTRDGKQLHRATVGGGKTGCGARPARALSDNEVSRLTAAPNACERCWGLAPVARS